MILAIETSTPCASLALADTGGNVIWEADFTTLRSHNSKIFTPVEEALGIADEGLSLIAVGVGPGSYSGVRVGISVANGLSFAKKIPAIGFSSYAAYSEGFCTIISDARRGTIAVATVKNRNLISEPDLLSAKEFAGRLPELDGPILTPDSHLAEMSDSIELEFPSAGAIAAAAAAIPPGELAAHAEKPLEPHYLRAPFITVAKKKPQPLRK